MNDDLVELRSLRGLLWLAQNSCKWRSEYTPRSFMMEVVAVSQCAGWKMKHDSARMKPTLGPDRPALCLIFPKGLRLKMPIPLPEQIPELEKPTLQLKRAPFPG